MKLTPRSQGEPHEEFVHRVAQWLGEHYECVQVFTHSTTEEGGIDAYSSGVGNLWAREMQVDRWRNGDDEDDDEVEA